MSTPTLQSLQADLTALTKDYRKSKAKVTAAIAEAKAFQATVEAFMNRAPAEPAPPPDTPPAPSDPNDPALFVLPPGNPRVAAVWDQWIVWAITRAGGRPVTETDWVYWRGKRDELLARGQELGQGDTYAWNRLIGMGAGGADKPTYGPFR